MTTEYAGPERRRFSRLPLEVPVEVLYPGYWSAGLPNPLMGTTHDLSEGGVCFSVNSRIPQRDIVLHLDYEGMGAEYVQAVIVGEHRGQAETWRYHCQFQRSLGAVDPMAVFDSLSL
jgi:hypothetical protein